MMLLPGERQDAAWPAWLPAALGALAVAGAVAFVAGVRSEHPLRAWQIYLVNWVFWTGITTAGVILTAIWHITSSIWGKAFQGVGVAGAGFFPVSLALFVPLALSGGQLFPWASGGHWGEHPHGWLTPARVFVSDGLALAALFGLASVFVYYRLLPLIEERRAAERAAAGGTMVGLMTDVVKQGRAERILWRLAPALCILYALVFSLLMFDLVMPLDEHFFSTLFGGYYFFGSLYAGLAWVAILSAFTFRRSEARGFLAPGFLHPLGKLLFGFCMFHGMLFYSQFLPIWYGNLPEEAHFLVVRSDLHHGPWAYFSIAFLVTTLLLPFTILMSKRVKLNPRALAFVACIVVVGMWLDKYVLIVPSLWHEAEHVPLGWLELGVTTGFAALVLLSYWAFSRFFPLAHFSPADLHRGH